MATDRKSFQESEQLRVLRSSGFLNHDLALKELLQAAQRIPGLGDTTNAWELITRDFFFRGDIADERKNAGEREIGALQKANIVNLDFTLGELLAISQEIPGLAESAAAWELITRDFVLRGDVAGAVGQDAREINL